MKSSLSGISDNVTFSAFMHFIPGVQHKQKSSGMILSGFTSASSGGI